MGEATEAIIDIRQEQMVSPTGDSKPTLRTAHFLKPTVATNRRSVPEPPLCSLSSLPSTFTPEEWPLKVNFGGWRKPMRNWATWVHNLESRYRSSWKKAGIYEAIVSSTFVIVRNYDFVIGLAEKWWPETNTFVFSWGEATITLEDMIVLGRYSVLGSPVSSCYVYESRELKEIEDKLAKAGVGTSRGKVFNPCSSKWMKKFMNRGSQIEHEAFLSLWLARYVFRDSEIALKGHCFPIAIRLARGERIALAPAVLASIYRDLSLLKETIVATAKFETGEVAHNVLALKLWSPFWLVQLWGWERFPMLQPKPLLIKNGDPRCALWDGVGGFKVENARLDLDSAGETFRWRPYAKPGVGGWPFPEFYREKGEWLDLESNEDLMSFSLCLRVGKMDGIGCIELYLPHRVAMQFGLDQDIPDHIDQSSESCKCASNNCIRPLPDFRFYFPPRLFEPDVTIRYLNWWRGSVQEVIKGVSEGVVRKGKRFRETSNQVPWVLTKNEGYDLDVPPGFPPKPDRIKERHAAENVKTNLEDSKSLAGFGNIGSLNEPEGKMQLHAEKDGLQKAVENSGVSKAETTVNQMASITEGNNTPVFPAQIVELEACIARLEVLIAKKKAGRFGAMLVKNPNDAEPTRNLYGKYYSRRKFRV